MIHGVYANKESFHTVEFTAGLNVVLAERMEASTQKDTRNGLGKTTLIEIIDFCLGSSGKSLRIEPLEEWAFSIDITIAGNRIRVTRSIEANTRIVIEGPTEGWIEQPEVDEETGERILSLNKWKIVLGRVLFNLPDADVKHKYKPSFRSMISYFIRTGQDAYSNPFRFHRSQNPWNQQLTIGFLLGLNWEHASQWQVLKDQVKAIEALDNAIKIGAIAGTEGTVGELETERVQLEGQIERDRKALANFKVNPQYEEIQEEADRVSATIHELTNQNVTERRRLARYMESIAAEEPPSEGALEELYEETGLVFPDAVNRTLDQARTFHQKIVENRKTFLETEVERLDLQIQGRNENISDLSSERAISLEILLSEHALQEMTQLQEKHIETKEKLERIKTRIFELKEKTTRKREIKTENTDLTKVAEQDHEERRTIWSKAINLFDENSQALYKRPGHLVIDVTDKGYKYSVEIERSSSQGIGKMKIFCFDQMLLQLAATHENQINFLIHDSILYDGVDSRQRALALECAAQITQELDAQYICTLNSDDVPRDDFSKDFNFDQHVRLTLTDKDPSGSLLGIRFERPGK